MTENDQPEPFRGLGAAAAVAPAALGNAIRAAAADQQRKNEQKVSKQDPNEFPVADGWVLCPHTHRTHIPDLGYYRAECDACGAWAASLYWPPVIPPTIRKQGS